MLSDEDLPASVPIYSIVTHFGMSVVQYFYSLGYLGPPMDIPSESAFQARPQGGICLTNETFERLARAYGDTVFRVACHALGNRPDAEDVSQSVLLKLYQTDKAFDSDDHAKHWLIRVTVNECRRLLRSPWRGRVLPLEDWDGPAAQREDHSDVLAAVMALPGKYRLCVYLYYFEQYPIRDIAQALGAKESTVQTRLQRAREQLKQTLSGGKEATGYV